MLKIIQRMSTFLVINILIRTAYLSPPTYMDPQMVGPPGEKRIIPCTVTAMRRPSPRTV